LNVPGERIVAVRSLRTPPAGLESDLGAVQSSEAVRLFVERARCVDRTFSVDATTAGAVTEICRRLDGIPLAIELAAARVNVLSVQEIRGRLRERFRLLTSGKSATLPRQQTLLAVIRWSYEHLAPEEQRLLRLLSVFNEGWTLAAATTVASAGADEFVVLDALARLVDRSLVVIERCPDGTSRYAMLESVRQYAQQRLDSSGEGIDARNRHLDYYLLCRTAGAPALGSPACAVGGAFAQGT
jgi:predicted ATPase